MKEVPFLSQGFNNVSVKKGDTFKIELYEGGIAGAIYDLEVIAGKATLIDTDEQRKGSVAVRTYTFKAQEAGDVEVVAHGIMHGAGGRKSAPLSFKLTVQ